MHAIPHYKTLASQKSRLIEFIQVMLEDIMIYFERFGCWFLSWRAKTAIAREHYTM